MQAYHIQFACACRCVESHSYMSVTFTAPLQEVIPKPLDPQILQEVEEVSCRPVARVGSLELTPVACVGLVCMVALTQQYLQSCHDIGHVSPGLLQAASSAGYLGLTGALH